MLSVAVKSEQAQGAAVVFRIRELLIRQRTHSKNALGGHIAQFDEVVPQWAANAPRLIVLIEDPATILPEMPRDILRVLVMTLCQLNLQISALDAEIKRHAHENATARRLMTITGYRPADRHGLGRFSAATRDVPPRTSLRRMAWPCATTTIHRRQAASRCYDKNGGTISAASSDNRSEQ
jgi:transposase